MSRHLLAFHIADMSKGGSHIPPDLGSALVSAESAYRERTFPALMLQTAMTPLSQRQVLQQEAQRSRFARCHAYSAASGARSFGCIE